MSPKVIGVLLIVMGLLYALLYVRWLRRPRTDVSATKPLPGPVPGPAVSQTARTGRPSAADTARPSATGTGRPSAAGSPPALTLAWAEGTYIGTTMAVSRHERVVAAKLAMRTRATMVVDDSFVRWERDGTGDLTVAGARLLRVSLERDPAGRAMSRTHIIRVSWKADNGDCKATAFLPRKGADSAPLVCAVQQLMKIGASIQDTPAQIETGPQSQVEAAMTPDGTP